jgi:WD repeat-containing protein 26
MLLTSRYVLIIPAFLCLLLHQLRKLSNEARQLGSSVGILSASSRLRERLGRVLYLFRENAADLFPQKVKRKGDGVPIDRRLNPRTKVQRMFDYMNLTPAADLDRKHLPSELHMFSRDISTLLECFSQFPDFVDEIPDQTLGEDLRVGSTQV